MTCRTHCTEVRVIVKMVYPVLIKVRAYTRFRFGKIEKVRSHYRRYWGIWCRGKDWAERLTISPLCFFFQPPYKLRTLAEIFSESSIICNTTAPQRQEENRKVFLFFILSTFDLLKTKFGLNVKRAQRKFPVDLHFCWFACATQIASFRWAHVVKNTITMAKMPRVLHDSTNIMYLAHKYPAQSRQSSPWA